MWKIINRSEFRVMLAIVTVAAVLVQPTAASAYTYHEFLNNNSPDNQGMCLGITGGDMTNGTKAVLWQCYNQPTVHPDQYWTETPAYDSLPDRPFSLLRNLKNFNKCLDVRSDVQGTQLVIWDCNGGGGEEWSPQSDGSWVSYSSLRYDDSLMVFGVKSAATGNGASIVLWNYQIGHSDQEWTEWTDWSRG